MNKSASGIAGIVVFLILVAVLITPGLLELFVKRVDLRLIISYIVGCLYIAGTIGYGLYYYLDNKM